MQYLWWVPGCRLKCVLGTDISLTSSGTLFRFSSITFNTCSVSFLSDTFSEWAVTPIYSPRSEFAVTLVASRPEDAFIDLFAKSILGATILSIAIKTAFWILCSTVSINGMNTSSSSSTEINESGGVGRCCRARFPEDDICSCCAAMGCAMALNVSGTLFRSCEPSDRHSEVISFLSLDR